MPWQDLAADLLGPLLTGDYLLVVVVVVDYFSRFFEVTVTMSVTASKVTSCLENVFATHGLPLSLKTDYGRQFVSEEFETYLKDNNIVIVLLLNIIVTRGPPRTSLVVF